MKQGMTNVDVAALAAELHPLVVGARLDRAYQPGKDLILLRLRRKGTGRIDLLFQLGRFVTAVRRSPENPDKPSMVAQVLRSALENARVTAFHQVGFDRILRMDLERGDGAKSLVFELFGDGNLVLLDAEGRILLPMRAGEFAARRVKKGEVYALPPGSSHPFALDAAGLRGAAAQGRSRDLVRFLALDLGFGPLWAEELCLRAGTEKSQSLDALPDEAWSAVHAAIQDLGRDIARNDLAPALVHEVGPEGPKPVDAVPFAMHRYPPPRFGSEEAPSFREALDAFFVGADAADLQSDAAEEDPRQAAFDEAKGKLMRQVEQVETAIAAFVATEAAARLDAETLYGSFVDAQALLDGLAKAHRERSWPEVESALAAGRAQGNAAALQVEELRPHDGTAVLRLAGPDGRPLSVEVDLRRSVQENAAAKYEVAKRAKLRREGAETALAEAQGRLEALERKGLDAFGTAPQRAARRSHHFWFETYRWTVTPGGLLAVGGRSAAQNDAVVKKYLRAGDRYVHAEIHGAPSVVVRPAEGPPVEASPEDLRAAAQFAVVSSRAWRQLGSATAYWVTPEQVSKTPRSGEYVPRGAWIIHGKRNVETDLAMEWWVGRVRFRLGGQPVATTEATAPGETRERVVPAEEPGGEAVEAKPDPAAGDQGPRTVDKLAGGTLEAMQRFSDGCVRLVPGRMDPNDAAQALADLFGVTVEEAQAVLPAGSVDIHPENRHPLAGFTGLEGSA